jgi:hypothetical protein
MIAWPIRENRNLRSPHIAVSASGLPPRPNRAGSAASDPDTSGTLRAEEPCRSREPTDICLHASGSIRGAMPSLDGPQERPGRPPSVVAAVRREDKGPGPVLSLRQEAGQRQQQGKKSSSSIHLLQVRPVSGELDANSQTFHLSCYRPRFFERKRCEQSRHFHG